MSEVIVTRRLFAYEFVIRTRVSVRENVERLDAYLAGREPPKTFGSSDSRLRGSFDGSTFTLTYSDALLWNAPSPVVEGYFVPNEEGSDVVVRVGQSRLSNWLWLPIGMGAVGVLWHEGLTGDMLGDLLMFGVAVGGLLIGPPIMVGYGAARSLAKIFP